MQLAARYCGNIGPATIIRLLLVKPEGGMRLSGLVNATLHTIDQDTFLTGSIRNHASWLRFSGELRLPKTLRQLTGRTRRATHVDMFADDLICADMHHNTCHI